jgi:alcohol dehydrogenase
MGVLSLYFEQGQATLRSLPALPVRAGWAAVRPIYSGICNTDLELLRGYYGFTGVPGHEFVGEVIAVGSPADAAWLGARVVGEINLSCAGLGRAPERWCDLCRRGWPRHCRQRRVLGIVNQRGAHAERLWLPTVNLHRVPDAVSTEDAVFVEPLAAACEILEQVRVEPGADRVAVLGDGKLGLLIAQVLKAARPRELVLIGKHRRKMKLAEGWGVATRSRGARLPQKEFDLVVEATGSSQGLETAVGLLRPRGTLVLKSTVHDRVSVDTAPIIVDELTVVGSRCGPFDRALDLLAAGRLRVGDLVDAVLPLEQAVEGLGRASRRGVLKVLLSR